MLEMCKISLMQWKVVVKFPDRDPLLPVAEEMAQAISKELTGPTQVMFETFRSLDDMQYVFRIALEADDMATAACEGIKASLDGYRRGGREDPLIIMLSVTEAE